MPSLDLISISKRIFQGCVLLIWATIIYAFFYGVTQ